MKCEITLYLHSFDSSSLLISNLGYIVGDVNVREEFRSMAQPKESVKTGAIRSENAIVVLKPGCYCSGTNLSQ